MYFCDAAAGITRLYTSGEGAAAYTEDVNALIREREGMGNGSGGMPGEARYSLREMADGQKYVDVYVDQMLFDNLTPKEQMQMAREVIRDRFVGKVIGTVNRAFVNGDTASEYTYPAKPIRDSEIMEVKARASTELDNLMDAGFNFRHREDGADGHVHESAVGGFNYFDVIFRIGSQMYQGVINLENNRIGTRLKDITKIKNITEGDYSSGDTRSRTVSQGDVSEAGQSTSINSISDSEGNSNTEIEGVQSRFDDLTAADRARTEARRQAEAEREAEARYSIADEDVGEIGEREQEAAREATRAAGDRTENRAERVSLSPAAYSVKQVNRRTGRCRLPGRRWPRRPAGTAG